MIDFDEVLDNRNQHLEKWEEVADRYGVPGDTGIPLWVADMDFRAPPSVNEATGCQLSSTHVRSPVRR